MSSDRQHHLPFISNYLDYQTNPSIQKPKSDPQDAKEPAAARPPTDTGPSKAAADHPFEQTDQMSCVYKSQSPTGKTILITTNNYAQARCSNGSICADSAPSKSNSSITIFTHNSANSTSSVQTTGLPSVTSSTGSKTSSVGINILINNHFNEAPQTLATPPAQPPAKVKSEMPDKVQCTMPDDKISQQSSVAIEKDAEVFVRLDHDRFHLGRVVQCSDTQCLVRFPDDSEYWTARTEVTPFSAQLLQPTCIVCKSAAPTDTIAKCVKCGRSYHPKCATATADGVWFCRRGHRNIVGGDSICDAVVEGTADQRSMVLVDEVKRLRQLPYSLTSLTWDRSHTHNSAQIYCYCGGNGEWFMQMLQCARCKQWFHEKCLNLSYPLYCGDRFYIFVCSMCNHGTEFVRRLRVKLDDLVHLLLFNLSVHNARKYFDLTKVIVPYAIANWQALQLKPTLKNLTVAEIKEHIIQTLQSDGQRFRRRTGPTVQYGLATPPTPPAAAAHTLPPTGATVTEKWLRDHFKDKAKLQMLPKSSPSDFGADLNEMRYTMTGKAYLKVDSHHHQHHPHHHLSDQSLDKDAAEHFSSEDDDEVLANLAAGKKYPPTTASSASSSSCLPPTPPTSESRPLTPTGSTTVDSDIYDYRSDSQDVVQLRPKLLHTQHKRKRGRPLGTKTLATHAPAHTRSHDGYSSDDNSSRGTLDLIIPPPKDFQGSNNPFLSQLHEPPATADAAAPSGTARGKSSAGKAGQVRLVRTVKRRLSVRDIVIGPDMQVKRRKIRRSSGNYEVISTTAIHTVGPIKPYHLPIRHDTKDGPTSSTTSTPSSSSSSTPIGSTTPTLPPPPPPPPSQPVYRPEEAYGLGGRRLRKRNETNYNEKPRRTQLLATASGGAGASTESSAGSTLNQIPGNAITSPVKGGEVSMTELQTSLTMYFGAANRIANGERFAVRGRRIGLDGHTQYLIEWDTQP